LEILGFIFCVLIWVAVVVGIGLTMLSIYASNKIGCAESQTPLIIYLMLGEFIVVFLGGYWLYLSLPFQLVLK